MIYIVTFEKHVNCQIHDMVFHCEAKNAKEAVALAKQAWIDQCFKPHQFHLHAVKSRIQDIEKLRVRGWTGKEYSGSYVMNSFFCTDFRTWRVNGINQYGPKAGQHYSA
jgi:hypothetical protein